MDKMTDFEYYDSIKRSRRSYKNGIEVEGCWFRYYERPITYVSSYTVINLEGKVVLDIGADWGSTPHFFITQGAKRVIAVEGDQEYHARMREHFKEEPNIVVVFKYIRAAKDIAKLIEEYKPDIVKIDCEGCERHLSMVQSHILKIPSDYMIETHLPYDILASLVTALCNAGFVCWKSTRGYDRNTGLQYFRRAKGER